MSFDRLNMEKCLLPAKSHYLHSLDEIPLPEDWTEQLLDLCADIYEVYLLDRYDFKRELRAHITASADDNNDTHAKLALIYKKLISCTNISEKKILVKKLSENRDKCPTGFKNRVNTLVMGFNLPESIPVILTIVRQSMVEALARRYGDGTHMVNQFSTAAETTWGVYPINSTDEFKDNIGNEEIEDALRQKFERSYTLHFIFDSLLEQITANLYTCLLYKGAITLNPDKSNAYTLSDYGSYLKFLAQIFNQSALNPADYLLMDEDFHVIDLNWLAIRRSLFRTLLKERYFILLPAEKAWIEYLCQSQSLDQSSMASSSGPELSPISVLFTNGFVTTASELRNLLSLIHPDHINLMAALLNAFIEQKEPGRPRQKAFCKLAEFFHNQPGYDGAFAACMEAESADFSQWLLEVSEETNHIRLIDMIIDNNKKTTALLRCLSVLTNEDKLSLLTWQNGESDALLLTAAKNSPEKLSWVLAMMSSLSPDEKYQVLKLRVQEHGNILTWMAKHNPDLLEPLMTHISDLSHLQKLRLLIQFNQSGESMLSLLQQSTELLQFLPDEREKKLVLTLTKLNRKVKQFKSKQEEYALIESSPYTVSKTLRDELVSCLITYLNSDKQNLAQHAFATTSRLLIWDARPVLSTHRNYQDVIAKTLLSLTIGGFFYLQCTGGLSQTFTKTGSAIILDELNEAVSAFQP